MRCGEKNEKRGRIKLEEGRQVKGTEEETKRKEEIKGANKEQGERKMNGS